MTTLEIRAALRLTGGDVVAAAELLASGSKQKLAALEEELARLDRERLQVIAKRDAVRAARKKKETARRILDEEGLVEVGAPSSSDSSDQDEDERKLMTGADFVALLNSSDDDVPEDALILDAPLQRDDDFLERIRSATPQRGEWDIDVLRDRGRADRPQTGDALLPPDIMNLIRPYVEFNERNEPRVRYPPETHFAYHSSFEPYRGPPPFDSRDSKYEFLRGSTWVDRYQLGHTTAKLLSLTADANGKLWGQFEYSAPGQASRSSQTRLSRKFGILSADELIPAQQLERYNFNEALTMECANAVAMQIPEFGAMENDGTIVRIPVTMEVMTTPLKRLWGRWFDPDDPMTSYPIEFELRGDTVRPTGGERLANNVMQNIKRVMEHCSAKQRPMRSITQGLRMRNDDQPPIGERVPPLTSEEITDDDYLPMVLWESPSKRAFRKSLLGHLDRKTLDGLQEHQFASFDDLEGLPLAGARDIFWIYGRGFFIRTPAATRQRTARFTRIRSVAVRTASPDAAYLVAPKYPIEEIGEAKTLSDIRSNPVTDVTPFVIDTPLPDGSFFAHGFAQLVLENELVRYQAEGDPINWYIDKVVERKQ